MPMRVVGHAWSTDHIIALPPCLPPPLPLPRRPPLPWLRRWTGITVSTEQLAEAVARVKAAGLSDRITLLFCDYRRAPLAAPPHPPSLLRPPA